MKPFTTKLIGFFTGLLLTCLFLSCAAPVNTSFERAATLGKGNVELMGSYTDYRAAEDGDSYGINHNFGFRAGLGISDRLDLKLRYERLLPSGEMDPGTSTRTNYFSLIPKVSIVKDRLAFLMPISMYNAKVSESGQSASETYYSLAPQFLATLYTSANRQFDFSAGIKGDYLFNSDDHEFLMGFQLGVGLSPNLEKWAIRPEFGYVFKPGESGHMLNYGVGLQFMLHRQ